MNRYPVLIPWLLAVCLAAASGCDNPDTELQLDDLTEVENRYVTRFVVLERAKAVALNDRQTGNVLLDSLAAAWGDSSLEKTLAGAPLDPHRSSQVHALLTRILQAEQDSLIDAARPDRLAAPLPDPVTEAKDPPADAG